MRTLTCIRLSFVVLFTGLFLSCIGPVGPEGPEGPQGPPGYDADVIYSEWFSPSYWSGTIGDWYFQASAPDLTSDVVERGVILGYVSFSTGDVYESTVRPLPAYALGVNWDFLIPGNYGSIEFTCDAVDLPSTFSNPEFRFVAIPGNIPALKSATVYGKSVTELKNMSYKDVCKLLNIPE